MHILTDIVREGKRLVSSVSSGSDSSEASPPDTGIKTENPEEMLEKLTDEAVAERLNTLELDISQILEDQTVKSSLDSLRFNDSLQAWVDEKSAAFETDEQCLLEGTPGCEQSQRLKALDAKLRTILMPLVNVGLKFKASDSRENKRHAVVLGRVFAGARRAMKDSKFRCFRSFCRALGYSHTQAYKLADLSDSFGDELINFHDFDLTTLHMFHHLADEAATYVEEHVDEIRNATPEALKTMVAATKPPSSGNSQKEANPSRTTIAHGPCVAYYNKKTRKLTADNFPPDWADQFFVWLQSLPLASDQQPVVKADSARGNSIDTQPSDGAQLPSAEHIPADWPPLESTVLSFEAYDFSANFGLDPGQQRGMDLRGSLVVAYVDAFDRAHSTDPQPLVGPELPMTDSELMTLWDKTIQQYPNTRSITITVDDQFMAGVRLVHGVAEGRWMTVTTQ